MIGLSCMFCFPDNSLVLFLVRFCSIIVVVITCNVTPPVDTKFVKVEVSPGRHGQASTSSDGTVRTA